MENRIKKIIVLALVIVSNIAFAQTKKTAEIKIQTSAECDMCKKRIESGLAYEKGIKFSNLDVPTKVLTVTYNTDKTSPEKIKQAVSKLGYDADEVKADSIAYTKLPSCCKAGAHDH